MDLDKKTNKLLTLIIFSTYKKIIKMSKINNPIAKAALEIFKDHPELEEIYVTSDGQGFTDKNKAENQARYLKDRTIKTFAKGFEENYVEEVEKPTVTELDREALAKEYEVLFGKSPAHNTKAETIAAKIAEKKAELAAVNGDGDIPAENVNPGTEEGSEDKEDQEQ